MPGDIPAPRVQLLHLPTHQQVLDALTATPARAANPAHPHGPDRSVAAAAAWSCLLEGDAVADRIGEWREVAAAATSLERDDDSVRLVLPADPEQVAVLARLCALETSCCTQARFGLDIAGGRVVLTARAPGAPGLLATLFPAGTPAEP